ncbi:nucleotide sugar dehydrogenase [Haloarcula onubensis]|uniref:UDP-N-acetyl-D-mannosamine dehydrogenase n=1 Tax=Haloarcula onubensis TaxID=2950539 RepID=A0ABU2FLF9_9EURY|nr:nucleotide sugar dehydrogenase [Halomicroarcula sp. S3CR25-11]MDS0281604.1 nucleotide sugar dehydrogenase [Halomicroarcula sp. S3CR25-11]
MTSGSAHGGDGTTTVSVHGLGYVGLPTAALFANNGCTVYGIDTQPDKLETLRTEGADFRESELNDYVDRVLGTDALRLRERPVQSDYHLVCVPTPFDHERGAADLSYVRAAAEGIAPKLRPGDTVIVESTVPPGTTANVVGETLERNGDLLRETFNLAFCPETVLPGSILDELRGNDRIVGGIDGEATAAARDLFADAVDGDIHTAPDAATAEFAKLAQNTHRDANIAIANELAKVARDHGVVPRPAFDLANEHPRVDLLHPGPGVGGHCLPVDPLYLGQHSDHVQLIEHARAVNDGMVEYVQELLGDALGSLAGKRVAVFGLAYKGNVADTRNSPARRFVETLAEPTAKVATDGGESAVDVRVHDPHVTDAAVDLWSESAALAGADALVFMTDHDEFTGLDPEAVVERMDDNVVVDARGLTDESWHEAGLDVRRL